MNHFRPAHTPYSGNVLDTISHANDDYGQIIHSHDPLVTAAEARGISALLNPSAAKMGGLLGLALAAWAVLRS